MAFPAGLSDAREYTLAGERRVFLEDEDEDDLGRPEGPYQPSH